MNINTSLNMKTVICGEKSKITESQRIREHNFLFFGKLIKYKAMFKATIKNANSIAKYLRDNLTGWKMIYITQSKGRTME